MHDEEINPTLLIQATYSVMFIPHKPQSQQSSESYIALSSLYLDSQNPDRDDWLRCSAMARVIGGQTCSSRNFPKTPVQRYNKTLPFLHPRIFQACLVAGLPKRLVTYTCRRITESHSMRLGGDMAGHHFCKPHLSRLACPRLRSTWATLWMLHLREPNSRCVLILP